MLCAAAGMWHRLSEAQLPEGARLGSTRKAWFRQSIGTLSATIPPRAHASHTGPFNRAVVSVEGPGPGEIENRHSK